MDADCGVCLDPGDYDAPLMYHENIVCARKTHKCCECNRDIKPSAEYQRVTGKWYDSFDTYRTCLDCMHIRDAFRCGGGFLFGQLWESLHEYRNDVNTGCVAKIKTISAKQYYMDWLRKERGIEN